MPVNSPARRQAAIPTPAPRRSPMQSLSRFLRTPKGTLLWILLGYIVLAIVGGKQHPLPDAVAAVAGAVIAEFFFARLDGKRLGFPSGAVISGLIIALVLAWQTPAYVPLLMGAVAVAGKHAMRTRWSNIFNPAVLALIVGALIFHSAQSWWGAVPLPGVLGFLVLFAGGWYMAAKVNKVPLALAFLTVAILGFTAASLFGGAAQVAQVYRTPDIQALVFFAAFMLTDPPTSPARHGDQVWFGAVAGVVTVAIFLRFGVQWFIIAGLPVANALESLRRVTARRPAAQAAPGRNGAPGARTAAPAARERATAYSALSGSGASAAAGAPAMRRGAGDAPRRQQY